MYYIHYLDPFRQPLSTADGHLDPAVTPGPRSRHPRLIIGGYSYGSIVTMQLPALGAILEPFASPAAGSAAAQVRLRAEHLATQCNEVLSSARESMRNRRTRSYGATRIRVGGDEEPGSPRWSGDGERERRSFSIDAEEKFRKSLHDIFHRHKERSPVVEHSQATTTTTIHASRPDAAAPERLSPLPELTAPRPAYLLISPVHGVAKHLALMNLWSSTPSRSHNHKALEDREAKLVHNPTLAVYGDRDGFVAASKLRSWAARLSGQEGSMFSAVEVAHGGHFWVEEGVLQQLKTAIEKFASSLLTET